MEDNLTEVETQFRKLIKILEEFSKEHPQYHVLLGMYSNESNELMFTSNSCIPCFKILLDEYIEQNNLMHDDTDDTHGSIH